MDNNVDVNEELKQKNQEMLYMKKKSDLDKSMESLVLFFKFHSLNLSSDINNKVCAYQNIDINSEQAIVNYNVIVKFFEITSDKLKEIIDSELTVIKEKINTFTDDEYNNELKKSSSSIRNRMLDYFIGINKEDTEVKDNGVINMLADELSNNLDEETKNKIYKYLYEVLSIKLINILKDNLMIAIQLISNNNKENQEVMDIINEKTIKGV